MTSVTQSKAAQLYELPPWALSWLIYWQYFPLGSRLQWPMYALQYRPGNIEALIQLHGGRTCVGFGNSPVNRRFYPTDVGWNPRLTREFPTPTCVNQWNRITLLNLSWGKTTSMISSYKNTGGNLQRMKITDSFPSKAYINPLVLPYLLLELEKNTSPTPSA